MNYFNIKNGTKTVMSNPTTCDMLLHPELLSNEQLITIIIERYLKIPSLETMPREALLEVFNNYCIPFAQRRRVTNRNKINSKIGDNTLVKFDILHRHEKALEMTKVDLDKSQDTLTGHMKRIKFSSESDNEMLCDMSPLKRSGTDVNFIEMDSPPVKRERKLITWP